MRVLGRLGTRVSRLGSGSEDSLYEFEALKGGRSGI